MGGGGGKKREPCTAAMRGKGKKKSGRGEGTQNGWIECGRASGGKQPVLRLENSG